MSESMRTAVVFPGQGSQRAGMVKDFHEVSAEARSVFEEASDACGLDFQAICFGEDERLNLTEFAQPCIVTAEIAIFRAVRALHGLEGEIFGGHSLGEYAALVAAGAVSLADAVRLVRTRGALMQEAVPAGEGAMIAVIGKELTLETLEDRLEGLEVDAANHNSPSQIVISGKAHDVETGGERLSGEGFRCVPLNVSAPFHSRLMRPIEPRFSEELAAIAIDDTAAGSVASNFTGGLYLGDAAEVRDGLVRQISGTVRWVENMQTIDASSDRVIEIGPGKPLSGFFREVGVKTSAILNVRTAAKAFAAS